MYDSYKDILCQDNKIQHNAIFYRMFYIQKPEILGYITICSVLACAGRSCTHTCTRGYYEEECIATCTCDAETCDDTFGCITTGKKCMHHVSR